MEGRLLINSLLQQLGAFSLTEEGVCDLSFEELDFAVRVPESGAFVQFLGFLFSLPTQGQKELYKQLLQQNLFSLETKGATFALDDKENFIVLTYIYPTEHLDFTLFSTLLKNFIETSLRWQQKFTHGELSVRKEIKEDDLIKNLKYKI